jgi:hypothetical protein
METLPTYLPTYLPTHPSIHPHISLSIYLWLYSPLLDFGRFLSFLIFYTINSTPWMGVSPLQGRYLHTGQHKHRINTHIHQCLKWDSNPRSQCLSGRRQFMCETARQNGDTSKLKTLVITSPTLWKVQSKIMDSKPWEVISRSNGVTV